MNHGLKLQQSAEPSNTRSYPTVKSAFSFLNNIFEVVYARKCVFSKNHLSYFPPVKIKQKQAGLLLFRIQICITWSNGTMGEQVVSEEM